MKRSASDPEWGLEVVRRWERRRWRVQQRDQAIRDLQNALEASFVGRFVRWLERVLDR